MYGLFMNMFLRSLGIIFSAAIVTSTSFCAEPHTPKKVMVPHLKTEVIIDGKLDEQAWNSAVEIGPFIPNTGKNSARVKTTVKLWYDDEALYLGWNVQDKDIQSTFTKRDSMFWEEEVVEFFVTSKALDFYYELQWNPLNAVFDATITNQLGADQLSKSFAGEWGFTAPTMSSKVLVRGTVQNSTDVDEGWVAEVRIPFKDLNLEKPKPGETWRGNFYRFNRDKGEAAEGLAWSPTLLPSFHEPSRFGYLEFGKLQSDPTKPGK